jgi:hypothetical protein
VEGDVSLADLIKVNKDMRGESAPAPESLEEISQAWRLAELGFSRLSAIVCGERDSGLREITETLDSSARSQDLRPRDCKSWLQLVLAAYEEALVDFRNGHLKAPPSFSQAIAANQRHMQFSCFVAAAAKAIPQISTPVKKEVKGEQQPPSVKTNRRQQGKQQQQERRKQVGEKSAVKEERQPDKQRQPAKQPRPKSDAWPDRPDFDGKRYNELQNDCRKQFPRTCSFWLLSGCRKSEAECTHEHKVPEGFNAFKTANAQ